MIFKRKDLWEDEKVNSLKNKILQIQGVYIPGCKKDMYVWLKDHVWKVLVSKRMSMQI